MADNYAIREGTGKITKFRSVELEGGLHLLIAGLADAEGNLLGSSSAPLPVSGTISTTPADLTAKGYQQITSLSAAAALTVPSGATVALIQAETKDVRWRDDGTNPTTSVGMIIPAGTSLFFTGSLSAFRVIETAASAKLNVSYYG